MNRLQLLLIKQNHQCFYCERKVFRHQKSPYRATIDHVQAKSCGGNRNLSNLVVACDNCNSRKGNLSIEEFHLIEILRPSLPPEEFSKYPRKGQGKFKVPRLDGIWKEIL